MNTQTAIPMPIDIPSFDFKMFETLNCCPNSELKRKFYYHLKPQILQRYAQKDHFDLQVIKRKCRNCGGSKLHWNGEPCWQCNATGIFRTDKVLLHRYILNGKLFHIPDTETPLNKATIVNTIEGLIEHKPVYRFSPVFAYGYLLTQYNAPLFFPFINGIVKQLKTNAQRKFKSIIKEKGSLKALHYYFSFNPEKEDLPF